MFEYVNAHQGQFWVTFGIILMVIEFAVLGLATMVLLFIGIGALITGVLMMAGILPETWTAGLASAGLFSGIATAVLWKPMKGIQGQREPAPDRSSDLIGLEFALQQNITVQHPGSYSYSGIDWRLEIDPGAGIDSISAGNRVRVISVDVGVFRVAPAG